MTKFRPCIDLHAGKVKQIVGGTLKDDGPGPTENFVSEEAPATFAERFRGDALTGGHVIQLGPGNREAAQDALAAWPGGLQIGGATDELSEVSGARLVRRSARRLDGKRNGYDADDSRDDQEQAGNSQYLP